MKKVSTVKNHKRADASVKSHKRAVKIGAPAAAVTAKELMASKANDLKKDIGKMKEASKSRGAKKAMAGKVYNFTK